MYREIGQPMKAIERNNAFHSNNYTKHKNTFCGHNVEFQNLMASSTYSNHYALKG
jgi:hypothetical protein